MIKIAITNEKGGTGKSTITCLLVEYLNHLNKKVPSSSAEGTKWSLCAGLMDFKPRLLG